MNLTKSFGEEIQKSMATTLCKEFPFLRQEALDEIAQQCKHTIFGEQTRESVAKTLRAEFPYLKQDALEEIAQQCKQAVTDRIAVEAPRMEASQAKVNLLTIPPEIRNRISWLVVTINDTSVGAIEGPAGNIVIELANYTMPWDDITEYHFAGNEEWMRQPPLTQVCRKLREETLPIYYANTFLLHVWEDRTKIGPRLVRGSNTYLQSTGTHAWLSSIGVKNRDLIKSVVLKNDSSCVRVCGDRFAAALTAAGVGLNNCVIKSYSEEWSGTGSGLRNVWKEIARADDNISDERTVEWDFSDSAGYNC